MLQDVVLIRAEPFMSVSPRYLSPQFLRLVYLDSSDHTASHAVARPGALAISVGLGVDDRGAVRVEGRIVGVCRQSHVGGKVIGPDRAIPGSVDVRQDPCVETLDMTEPVPSVSRVEAAASRPRIRLTSPDGMYVEAVPAWTQSRNFNFIQDAMRHLRQHHHSCRRAPCSDHRGSCHQAHIRHIPGA